jgi:hypothetical protein
MMPSMFCADYGTHLRGPYDGLFSLAVRDEDPRERMAELGDAGFISSRSMSLRDWSAYTT